MNMQDELQTKLDNDLISSIDLYVKKELSNMGYKMIFKKSKKKERAVITCLEP